MGLFLALDLSPGTPDDRIAGWIPKHFPFLHPSRAKAEIGLHLESFESSACKGRISTVSRLPPPTDLFSGPYSCAHELLLGGRSPVRAWRAKGPDARWHPLTSLKITRLKTFSLVQILLHAPAWSPQWECPPLRRNDDENWAALIEGFLTLAQDAGGALRSAITDAASFPKAARAGVPKLRRG